MKGLFNPAVMPMNSLAPHRGGVTAIAALMNTVSDMNDASRANFERTMKVPSFDVGMANLAGNNGDLYVNLEGIKFFRFQNEANPRIWSTGTVSGSYTSDPSLNTRVQLNSTGDLVGLRHTFEVRQWDTNSHNWGASIYNNGTTDTGGMLTRSGVDAARAGTGYLPAGASGTIPITELRGSAAGRISTGTKTFTGAAAGAVR